uniref:Gamma-glutamyltransferase 5-like n=1 Tax=Pundamilia nyererei TaxID=303518 RepID=A0A3B4F6B7_9CICH
MCPPNEDIKDEDVESAKTRAKRKRLAKVLRVLVAVGLFVVGLIVGALVAGLLADYYGYWKGRSECKDTSANCPFSKAAVAADSWNCSEIGRNILQKGGSAVDAAIAALLCTSIINPQCAGIGGGVIFTVMDSSGKVKIINSRETVPRNVNSDLLKLCRKTTEWTMECRWIGVPGEIRGYEAAHRLYGKLPWADLFQPTIKLILFYHRYIEALKFANGLKKHIRDPNFSSDKVSISKFAPAFLISSDKTHDPQYYGKNSYLDSIGTTHVSVLAEDGSAVSVTSSINDEFGSNVLSSSTGIILNNHLNDFCGRAHNIFHGERPPSNMAPSVLKSPSKTLVIGGSGSEMIPPAVASALMNHLWFGKSLKEAIDTLVVLVDSQSEVKLESKLEKVIYSVYLNDKLIISTGFVPSEPHNYFKLFTEHQ